MSADHETPIARPDAHARSAAPTGDADTELGETAHLPVVCPECGVSAPGLTLEAGDGGELRCPACGAMFAPAAPITTHLEPTPLVRVVGAVLLALVALSLLAGLAYLVLGG